MAKFNPNRYARAEGATETKTFYDPFCKTSLTISLRPIVGFTAYCDYAVKARELREKYVTGYDREVDGNKTRIEPALVIDGNGKVIRINEQTCEAVAHLVVMQTGDDTLNDYEWMQTSGVAPIAFTNLFEFAQQMNEAAAALEKNVPAENAGSTSAPISAPQADTQASISAQTPSPSVPTAEAPSLSICSTDSSPASPPPAAL